MYGDVHWGKMPCEDGDIWRIYGNLASRMPTPISVLVRLQGPPIPVHGLRMSARPRVLACLGLDCCPGKPLPYQCVCGSSMREGERLFRGKGDCQRTIDRGVEGSGVWRLKGNILEGL